MPGAKDAKLLWNREAPRLVFDDELMKRNSYSRSEVVAAGSELPTRGLLCDECGEYIPVFEDFSEEDQRRVIHCFQHDRAFMAMLELRRATGCSLEWAKLWVYHRGKPNPAKETKPCPYCGEPLRTSLAKQCRFCWRDWHDEGDVGNLRIE
jgi:hypothetical protein